MKYLLIPLVLVIIGGFAVGTGMIDINNLFAIGSGTVIINPEYGKYSCEPMSEITNYDISAPFHPLGLFESPYFDSYMICPGNTPRCQFGVNVRCDGWLGCDFFGGWEHKNTYGIGSGWNDIPLFSLSNGATKQIWFSREALTSEAMYFKLYGAQGSHIVKGSNRYTPYHLVQTAANGYTEIAKPDGCERPTIRKISGDKNYPELCTSGCVKDIAGNRVPWDGYWNYLGGYTLAPPQTLHVDTDGTDVYCQPAGGSALLKTLKSITTEGGSYVIPDLVKRTVECCPGQSLGSSWCENDFKWSASSSCSNGKCDIFSTINSCPGAGAWVIDLSDTTRQTIFKATGCDASDCCTTQTQQVECTTSFQCPPQKPVCQNYVCQASSIDPFLPTCGNRVCEPGENDPNSGNYCPQDCLNLPSCGDGVCDQGETAANCPADCGGYDYLLFIVLGFIGLGAAIGYFKRSYVGALFGGIIGAVSGFAIYLFLSWLVDLAWWQTALLGIGVVGGGGVLIYILGPAIVGAIAVAVAVLK